ncbi:hypothetical protein [Pannonibacter tanglangensis]|uniref:hypothetical protein n=1 Tax=Pannonibacter tanglangensis TaxID=2750084 RepID=UPI001AD8FF27|nr:hypothetical protein [Pannonibacter sp. XCT-53]
MRLALHKILTSAEFATADQLRAFLRFVVEAAISDQIVNLKGYTIATAALGRGPDFNPNTDPIVRVEAARLRKRLQDYYAGSGRDDPIRIDIPKGSYAPRFELPPAPSPSPAAPRIPPETTAAAAPVPARARTAEQTAGPHDTGTASVTGDAYGDASGEAPLSLPPLSPPPLFPAPSSPDRLARHPEARPGRGTEGDGAQGQGYGQAQGQVPGPAQGAALPVPAGPVTRGLRQPQLLGVVALVAFLAGLAVGRI